MMSREREVTRALLSLTEHVVTDDDSTELLAELAATAVRLLDVSACSIVLACGQDELEVVAASSDAARTLQLLQLQHDEGPCLDCFRARRVVSVPDLDQASVRWPTFSHAAGALGFACVHAVPLMLQDQVLGAIDLFGTEAGELTAQDAEIAEALSHVAGIALVAQRLAAERKQLAEQLQHALDSRVVIEQCKGMLAAAGGLGMDEAFRSLRRYARDNNLGLTAVAESVATRALHPGVLLGHAGP